MDAIARTAALVRVDLPLELIDPQVNNPNEMSDREFNLLVDNMEKVGFVDPMFVKKLSNGRYRTIGGHHRFKAARFLGFDNVPCTVIEDDALSDDLEKYQIVRMNMIRGRLNADQFLKLYESLGQKYEADLMADAFGFSSEEEFKKLIGQMAKTLPKDMQKEFKKAAEQVKTIDGLSKLLNQMFAKHGDTLPYGYMMVDFGGKDSIWLRMAPVDKEKFLKVAAKCVEHKRTVDSLMRVVLQSIADGEQAQLFDRLKDFPEVEAKGHEVPTEDALGVQ